MRLPATVLSISYVPQHAHTPMHRACAHQPMKTLSIHLRLHQPETQTSFGSKLPPRRTALQWRASSCFTRCASATVSTAQVRDSVPWRRNTRKNEGVLFCRLPHGVFCRLPGMGGRARATGWEGRWAGTGDGLGRATGGDGDQ